MNWRQKRKQLIALAVTFAVLFSTMGAAATKTIELDVQPTVTGEAEPETEEETRKETESEAEEETKEEIESEAEEETKEETESEAEEETEGETESETEEETEEETELETEEETKEETESETKEETKEETKSETEEETKEETESEAEEETEEETESEAEEETKEETESETEEGTKEETESESGEETKKETESETGEGAEKENEPESEAEDEEETKADDLLKDSNNELSAEPEPSNAIPTPETIPDAHKHSWSGDWNYDESYHWHECDADDCPVTDSSEKDGYAEHRYSADNICTDCGYFNPESQIAGLAEGVVPTYQEAYDAMIALKDDYPEGMTWTNFTPYGSNGPLGDSYVWHGGYIYGANRGVGCSAFAFILSDEAFGSLPARAVDRGSFTFEDVKVGDILRVNNNSHSVIVLQKSAGGVVVAEANHNKSVHWGRVISETEVLTASYMITRYPEDYIPEDDPDADEIAQDGTAGKLKWSLTNAGVLTISGSGAIPDYSSTNLPPWHECNVSTIVMEKGVTGIGDYAFYQSDALSTYIPDGIIEIGESAFENSGLISVTVPGTVGDIGNKAFYGCKNLTSVTVSKGVETIGDEAFRGCTSLTHIDFPASIVSVGAGAFMSCSEMTSVRFMPGSGTAVMGDNLFSQCQNLTSVTLPQTADRISAGMFQSCTSLPSLYIPASVKEIGENPFTSCKFLKYIYFGGSEAEWKGITTPYLEASLKSTGTTVVFDVEFDDPFAEDPDDPGDFLPDEEKPTDPGDGEKPTEPDPGDGSKPANPDDGNKPTEPAPGDGSKPTEPDDSNKPTEPAPDGGNKPAEPGDSNKPTDPDNGDSAHRHSWSEEWSYDQTGHWHECASGCFITDNRDKDGYGAHLYGPWVTDVSATVIQSGSRHRDCTVCHYRQTENIPAAGSSGSPDDHPGSSNGSSGSNGSSASSNGSSGGSNGSTASSNKSGNTIFTTIRKNADGSGVVSTIQRDGTVITTATDAAGKVEIAVKLSESAVSAARQQGQAVSLPISAVQGAAMNSAITVYTGSEPVKVAIPAASPTPGTVAVIVHADGSTEVMKASVPTENSVVVALPNGATIKLMDNRKSFLDVPAGAWFEDAVAFVSARGLFYDTTPDFFAPDAPMTYAALMTALAGFDGAETDGGTTWYAKSMEWAVARGISDGLNPEGNIAYGELLTVLWKYLGSPETANYSGSTGTGAVGIGEAQKAMNWAVESGIVSGFEAGSLDPQGPISRAQSAQIIMNFIKYATLNPVRQ